MGNGPVEITQTKVEISTYINVKLGWGTREDPLDKPENHLTSLVTWNSQDKEKSISLKSKVWEQLLVKLLRSTKASTEEKDKIKTVIIWWKRKIKPKASKYSKSPFCYLDVQITCLCNIPCQYIVVKFSEVVTCLEEIILLALTLRTGFRIMPETSYHAHQMELITPPWGTQ